MKILEVPKPYSWLEWPVVLKGCSKPQLHITAKFFGHAPIDPDAVKRALGVTASPLALASVQEWQPLIFHELCHVLILTKRSPIFDYVHDRFELIKDDFTPYRPHITVPKEYWEKVCANDLKPAREILEIGALQLCLGVLDE